MRGLLVIVAMVLMLAPPVRAQNQLHSAALPDRPIGTPAPDLFRATPQTYGPHPASPTPPVFSGAIVYGGGWPYNRRASARAQSQPRRQPLVETGFLRLTLQPDDAQVFVDGAYVGTVGDRRRGDGTLTAGNHRIELRANGYRTRAFDVRITPGDTTTYREDLERETPPAPLAPVPVAAPRTMYVIPGCYAGDRPPSRTLPHGCDRSKLRTIAPVVADVH
jgi:hypothetical protein